MPHPPLSPTLFPYTTLFRSQALDDRLRGHQHGSGGGVPELGADVAGPRPVAEPRLPGCGVPRHRGRRSEEHTSELQSRGHLVCRLLLEKKKTQKTWLTTTGI